MTKTALDTPETPGSKVPVCGCCGRGGRRMAELGLTPGVYICRRCSIWAFRRAGTRGGKRCD
jgi:hypothetical protein